MKKELPHFEVGEAYGGSQDWFASYWMRLGGYAAATACDCAIYFDWTMGTHLYPFDSGTRSFTQNTRTPLSGSSPM